MKPLPKSSSALARRQRIMDAALSLFRAKGYVEASVGDIARASDSSTAIVYKHFDNKLALFGAVLDQEIGRLCDMLDGIADQAERRSLGVTSNSGADHRATANLRVRVLLSMLYERIRPIEAKSQGLIATPVSGDRL